MRPLEVTRDHCRVMAAGLPTTVTLPSGRSARVTSDPKDRPLWAQLADEIDAHLGGDIEPKEFPPDVTADPDQEPTLEGIDL